MALAVRVCPEAQSKGAATKTKDGSLDGTFLRVMTQPGKPLDRSIDGKARVTVPPLRTERAVRAREGDMGIIPGSMGARSYIVRGKGNPESFMSCSHGAGRAMSRTEAKRRFTLDDHAKATAGVECRKDADVIDETPMAYKSIDAVMEAQRDLVDVVHTLRQVVCVKG